MHVTHLFWPPDRKLFRQRSRLRGLAPALAAVAVAMTFLAFAVGQVGWSW